MKIIVGGKEREYSDGLTVTELIEAEDVETPMYVTVAINDDFILSENFETTVLSEGDSVEFMYFLGGGSHVL